MYPTHMICFLYSDYDVLKQCYWLQRAAGWGGGDTRRSELAPSHSLASPAAAASSGTRRCEGETLR